MFLIKTWRNLRNFSVPFESAYILSWWPAYMASRLSPIIWSTILLPWPSTHCSENRVPAYEICRYRSSNCCNDRVAMTLKYGIMLVVNVMSVISTCLIVSAEWNTRPLHFHNSQDPETNLLIHIGVWITMAVLLWVGMTDTVPVTDIK